MNIFDTEYYRDYIENDPTFFFATFSTIDIAKVMVDAVKLMIPTIGSNILPVSINGQVRYGILFDGPDSHDGRIYGKFNCVSSLK